MELSGRNSVIRLFFLVVLLLQGLYASAKENSDSLKSWDLASDWSTTANPHIIDGGQWTYHTRCKNYFDWSTLDFSKVPEWSEAPIERNEFNKIRWAYYSDDANYTVSSKDNCPSVLPANYSWNRGFDTHISLNKFIADANDLITNFKAGDIGGHAPIGATWTTLTGGTFEINYSGFLGRSLDKCDPEHQVGINVVLHYEDPYGHKATVMRGGLFEGSDKAVSFTKTIRLNAGESVTVALEPLPGNPADWAGMSFSIRESREACQPYPKDGAVCVGTESILKWEPGTGAKSHNVYIGTNHDEINNASNPVAVLPAKGDLSECSYKPFGTLDSGTTYYWRVDEVCDGVIQKGPVWSFKTAEEFQQKSYKLWTENSMRRVFPASRPKSYPENPEVNLSMAGGEYESFQIVILPEADMSLCGMSVELSDLVKGSDVIKADEIEWYLVGYVNIINYAHLAKRESYIDKAAADGWWPDLLLPVDSFCITKKGHAQPVWITAYVPEDTPGGNYTGTVTIKGENCSPSEIKLNLKVYDFTLAKGAGHCRTAFALREERIAAEEYVPYAEFMLKHRLNPDNIYRIQSPKISELEHFFELGMNSFTAFCVSYHMDDTLIDNFFADLKKSKYSDELREIAMFYGYDEIEKDRFDELSYRFKSLEKKHPDIERVTTARFHPYFDEENPAAMLKQYWVDGYCPLTLFYNYDRGEQIRQSGRCLWSYICVGPHNLHLVNLFIYYPLMESRILWWQMYHQEMDGFLYYDMISGTGDTLRINPEDGPFVNYHFQNAHIPGSPEYISDLPPGDGLLIYPGKDGPIASLRLANIRDGLEDYEYLWLLAQRAGSIEVARRACEPVTWGLLVDPSFTHDISTIENTRDNIAKVIESRNAVLPGPANGAINVDIKKIMDWMPGKGSTVYDVYFSTDFDDVNTASVHDDGVIFKGRYPLEHKYYDPGILQYDTTYYWRIDTYSIGSKVSKGDIWSFTTKPKQWDAKADWSDKNNPDVLTSPPYGTWSYRDAASGNLLSASDIGINGSPGGWSIDGTANVPNLFDDNWLNGEGHDINEFAGHGPWLVQWTSPVTGKIEITGSLWQKSEPERRMSYKLLLNGKKVIDEGYVPEDDEGNTIVGRAGIVNFGPISQSVSKGDTIEMMVDGSASGGDGQNTFAVATFIIKPL